MSKFLHLFALAVLVIVDTSPQRASHIDIPANVTEARTVLNRAKGDADNIKDSFSRRMVLDEIGAAEVKAGDLDAAVQTARKAYPNTMATLTAIGLALGDANDLAKVQSIKPQLQGGGGSTVMAFFAKRQAEKGHIADSLKTASQIAAPEVRRDALEFIAQEQASTGQYSEALASFALGRKTNPQPSDDEEYPQLQIFQAQVLRGDTETAQATLRSMKSKDARAFAMMGAAQVLSEKGNTDAARQWLREALKNFPSGTVGGLTRYFLIPAQTKILGKEETLRAAGSLPIELRVKGYDAVAVACAEMKDVECVEAAFAKMKKAVATNPEEEIGDFEIRLQTLNITAALIENSEFEMADRLLKTVEQNADDVSSRSLLADAQLQRAVMMARQDGFDEAVTIASKIRPNEVSDNERGTALRITALLETTKMGSTATSKWASALSEREDRAYALLGIAQSLLGIGETKLSYNAIQVH